MTVTQPISFTRDEYSSIFNASDFPVELIPLRKTVISKDYVAKLTYLGGRVLEGHCVGSTKEVAFDHLMNQIRTAARHSYRDSWSLDNRKKGYFFYELIKGVDDLEQNWNELARYKDTPTVTKVCYFVRKFFGWLFLLFRGIFRKEETFFHFKAEEVQKIFPDKPAIDLYMTNNEFYKQYKGINLEES